LGRPIADTTTFSGMLTDLSRLLRFSCCRSPAASTRGRRLP
jgi:hypothetical protein